MGFFPSRFFFAKICLGEFARMSPCLSGCGISIFVVWCWPKRIPASILQMMCPLAFSRILLRTKLYTEYPRDTLFSLPLWPHHLHTLKSVLLVLIRRLSGSQTRQQSLSLFSPPPLYTLWIHLTKLIKFASRRTSSARSPPHRFSRSPLSYIDSINENIPSAAAAVDSREKRISQTHKILNQWKLLLKKWGVCVERISFEKLSRPSLL